MRDEKKILIIAGPNGAGKTIFAHEFLPNEANCPVFVNADLIAAGLSPFQLETAAVRAGRIMLERIAEHARRGISFAFETTLSGRGYARFIPQWQNSGYIVKLFFLQLPNSEMAIARVRQMVRGGGHSVPKDVVHRRFYAGLKNLHNVYKPLVSEWTVFDNSGSEPILLVAGVNT